MPRGQRVGEVVVFSGRATVHGVATGDVVVLEGPVTVTGQVNGSVIAADGVVRLAESARVGGDVFSSETIVTRPGAEVGGDARSDVRFSFEGPLVALGKLLGPVAVSVSVLLTGLALLLLAPRGADAVAETLTDAPLASLGWGILVALAVPVVAGGARDLGARAAAGTRPAPLAGSVVDGGAHLGGVVRRSRTGPATPRSCDRLPRRMGDPRGDRPGADPERRRVDARARGRAGRDARGGVAFTPRTSHPRASSSGDAGTAR